MEVTRNLDLLRAMAVLAVFVAHCFPKSAEQQAVGRYGVLIFFVHTSLVLLFSLNRISALSWWAGRFYVQRIVRIYPLSVLCILVTLAFGIGGFDSALARHDARSIAANLLLAQNLQPGGRSISSPMWSLPYEMQMYLVLPLVFWVLKRHRREGALLLISLSIVLPYVETLLFPATDRFVTRYVPCFMAGAIAYAWIPSSRRLPWYIWPTLICTCCWLYTLISGREYSDWLASIALGILIPRCREVPAGRLSRAAALIARYSYGIYLSHVPLLWFCFHRNGSRGTPERWIVFALFAVITPWALYHLIEAPMIRVGKNLARVEPSVVGSREVKELDRRR